MSDDGIMITQSESPRFNSKVFKEIYQTYRGIFGQDKVHCYLAYIPTYPTGMWSFSYSSKGKAHPLKQKSKEEVEAFAQSAKLKYYNADLHQAAFALPTFVRDMIG